jgi:hypothetical protein
MNKHDKRSGQERKRFVAENIDKPVAWLADQLGVSTRTIDTIKSTLRGGKITGREQEALERRRYVAEHMDDSNVAIRAHLGISTRAISGIKSDIRGGRTKNDGTLSKENSSPAVPKNAFDAWLAEIVRKKFELKRPPATIATLHKVLVKGLPKTLKDHKKDVTKGRIYQELEEIFWKGRAPLLRDAINAGYSPTELYELLKNQMGDRLTPPKWVVEAKYEYMKGLSRAPREKEMFSLPGILRVPIGDVPSQSLPETSFEKPFHALHQKDGDRFRVALISAPQLGLAYDPDIELNLTRCGIAAARKDKCDALVIAGGLFRIMWQKTAGPNRLLIDLAMGSEVDIESIATSYRDRMREIIESGSFDPIFVTAKERFIDLLRGWYKVLTRPDKTPEFNGPIYVVLAPDDLGLVRRMAYFELLYKQNQELSQAIAEKSLLVKIAAEAHVYKTSIAHDGTKAEILAAEKAYNFAKEEAEKVAENLSRLRMTNLDPTQNIKVYKQALSYLLHEIKKHIPGWKVIGQNTAYVKFGKSKHVIKFVSGDSSNPHLDELGSYGPAQRQGKLPALTISSSPRTVYPRKTTRENYLDGSMEGTVSFAEAPMLVDKKAILAKTDGNKVPHPAVKAVGDSMFNGGMTIIKIDPDFGVSPDFINAEAVRRIASPGGRPVLPPVKRLWLMVATDLHFGGSMRVFLKRPSGIPIGLTEAVFELMQKWGLDKNGVAPVAGLFVCDDITHGNHFGTHVRPHYNVLPLAQVSTQVENDLKQLPTDPKEREKKMRKMISQGIDQMRFSPPHYLTGQFQEVFHGFIRPYPDVFKGILLAGKQANLTIKGVSDYARTDSDMRDLGAISFGSGNHATKTTEGMLHEGVMVAETLRMRLWDDPDLAGMNLDRLISAPLFQDTGIAYGTIKVGETGYTWGVHVSGTPPKRDSWKDTLHGWVQVNRQRGNPSSILNGVSILHMTGDKHFFSGALAGNDVYVMGPSSTHTDSYAETAGGLTENNCGVAFVGLPIEGPDSGEISIVHLTREPLQRYITSGEPFPWDKLLPDNVLKK